MSSGTVRTYRVLVRANEVMVVLDRLQHLARHPFTVTPQMKGDEHEYLIEARAETAVFELPSVLGIQWEQLQNTKQENAEIGRLHKIITRLERSLTWAVGNIGAGEVEGTDAVELEKARKLLGQVPA